MNKTKGIRDKEKKISKEDFVLSDYFLIERKRFCGNKIAE